MVLSASVPILESVENGAERNVLAWQGRGETRVGVLVCVRVVRVLLGSDCGWGGSGDDETGRPLVTLPL